MAPSDDEVAEASRILASAIESPFSEFDQYNDAPIQLWYSFLSGVLPLTTLQAGAFERLGGSDLPTTYPLERILRSILSDEGWVGWDFPDTSETPFSLVYNLAARRKELGEGTGRPFESAVAQHEGGGWRLRHEHNLRGLTEIARIVERDEDGLVAANSVYDDIGRELVARIEHRDSHEPGTEEARQAQKGIDAFQRQIKARRGRGKPPRAASDQVLDALYREGTDLLRIVWPAVRTTPSEQTREFLAHHGVGDQGDQDAWARHLAVPVLSSRELTAVLGQAGARRVTPRRMSIHLLAHRFDLAPSHVGRRVVGSLEEENLKHVGRLI